MAMAMLRQRHVYCLSNTHFRGLLQHSREDYGTGFLSDLLPSCQCASIYAQPCVCVGHPNSTVGQARIIEGHCPRGHATAGTL